MNALDRVREKYGNPARGTDRTDKRPSVGFVGAPHRDSQQFIEPVLFGHLSGSKSGTDTAAYREAWEERAAIIQFDAEVPRADAERLAGVQPGSQTATRDGGRP
jgi:hypothetical protein